MMREAQQGGIRYSICQEYYLKEQSIQPIFIVNVYDIFAKEGTIKACESVSLFYNQVIWKKSGAELGLRLVVIVLVNYSLGIRECLKYLSVLLSKL